MTLEDRVTKLENLTYGQNTKTPGILALVTSLAEDIHGADGKSGMKAELHETADAVKGAKQWVAGGVAIGSICGAIIVWLLEKFVVKP